MGYGTPLDVPFGLLDESTSSKLLPPQLLTRVENLRRDEKRILRKRNGFAAVTLTENTSDDAPSEVLRLGTREGTVVVHSTNGVYTIGDGQTHNHYPHVAPLGRLADVRSLEGAISLASSGTPANVAPSVCQANGIVVCVWASGLLGTYQFSIFNEATGTSYNETPSGFGSTTARARCITVGNTCVVVYADGSTLRARTIDLTSETTVAAGISSATSLGITVSSTVGWDIVAHPTSSEYFVVYNNSADADTYASRFNLSHALQANVKLRTQTTASQQIYAYADADLALNVLTQESTDGIYYHNAPLDLSGAGTAILIAAHLFSTERSPLGLCKYGDDEIIIVYNTAAGSGAYDIVENIATAPSLLFGSGGGAISRTLIRGRMFWTGTAAYGVVYIDGAYALADFGSASSPASVRLPRPVMRFAAGVGQNTAHMGDVAESSVAENWLFAASVIKLLSQTTSGANIHGPSLYKFDLSGEHLKTLEFQGSSYSDHGGIFSFDGSQFSEVGFWDRPVMDLTAQTSGGSLADGVYQVSAVFAWIDFHGRLHRSEPSDIEAVTVSGGGGSGSIDYSISPLQFTIKDSGVSGKGGLFIELYVSPVGETALYKQLSGNSQTTFSGTLQSVGSVSERLYTDGDVLANVPPPPSLHMIVHRGRAFFLDAEDPFRVTATKQRATGEGLAPSDEIELRFDHIGRGVALASQDARLLVFSRTGITSFYGDGPSRNGVGQFDGPIDVSTGTGCIDARSIVYDALGNVYFQSSLGIEILPRGGAAPQWVGEAVQDTLADYPVIVDTAHDEQSSLVMFVCQNSAGTESRVLSFDYRDTQWFIDTPTLASSEYAVRSLVNAEGILYYSTDKATGAVWQQDSGFDDGSTFVNALVETGDINFNQVGRTQIPDVYVLGEYLGPCNIRVQASFDGGVSWPCFGLFELDNSAFVYESESSSNAAFSAGDGVVFTKDGFRAYVVEGGAGALVYQLDLTRFRDLTSVENNGVTLDISSEVNSASGIDLSDDETMFIIGDLTSGAIYQYNMTEPRELGTASYSGNSLSTTGQDIFPQGPCMSRDGRHIYMVGDNSNTIYQYDIPNPKNISTGSYSGKSKALAATGSHNALAVRVSSDKKKIFTLTTTTDKAYSWDIVDGDVSTASNEQEIIDVNDDTGEGTMIGFFISENEEWAVVFAGSSVYSWTAAERYVRNEPIQLRWQPRIMDPESGRVRYRVTVESAGTADSAGVSLAGLTLMTRRRVAGPRLLSGARA